MALSRERLYSEVHYLAYHYKWAEDKILRLSLSKRKIYIDLLTEQIKAENKENSS